MDSINIMKNEGLVFSCISGFLCLCICFEGTYFAFSSPFLLPFISIISFLETFLLCFSFAFFPFSFNPHFTIDAFGYYRIWPVLYWLHSLSNFGFIFFMFVSFDCLAIALSLVCFEDWMPISFLSLSFPPYIGREKRSTAHPLCF